MSVVARETLWVCPCLYDVIIPAGVELSFIVGLGVVGRQSLDFREGLVSNVHGQLVDFKLIFKDPLPAL